MKKFEKKPFRKRFKPREYIAPKNLSPYEHSLWLLNSFSGRSVALGFNESFESLFRRFKRVVEASGIMRELKKREFYVSDSEKKKEKQKKAAKRIRKRRKFEEVIDFDAKKPERT